MMRRLLIITQCLILAGSASAVITYTDDFGGPVGTLDPGWTDNGSSATTYNGAGVASYSSNIDETWSILHDIGTGDFHAELSMNNFLYPNGGYGFTQFYLHLNDTIGGQQMGFKTWSNAIYVENIDAVTFAGNWLIDPIPADQMTSFDMEVEYNPDTGLLDLWYSINDGPWKVLLGTYASPGDASRNLEIRTSFWGTSYNAGATSALDIDYFSVVPEPATIALLGLGGILLRKKRV